MGNVSVSCVCVSHNGKHGEGKEGQILLVFSFMPAPAGAVGQPGIGPNLAYVPGGVQLAYPPQVLQTNPATMTKKQQQQQPIVYQSNQPVSTATVPAPAPSPPRPTFNPEDFKQVISCFMIHSKFKIL